MRYRTMVFAALIVATATVAVAQPATAGAKTVKGTGTLTCALGGAVNFTPPLSQSGTTGYKNEVVLWDLNASSCTGPTTNTPDPGPAGATLTIKSWKFKDDVVTPIGSTKPVKVAGACSDVTEFTGKTLHLKAAWTGVTIKGTKVVDHLSSGATTAKGSYFGSATITLVQTAASQAMYQAACPGNDGTGGTGTGSDPQITLDSTMSSLTIGAIAASSLPKED